jgi:hypothetical protein
MVEFEFKKGLKIQKFQGVTAVGEDLDGGGGARGGGAGVRYELDGGREGGVYFNDGHAGGVGLDGGGGRRGTRVEAVGAASRRTWRRSDQQGPGVEAVGATSRQMWSRSGRQGADVEAIDMASR